MTKREQIDLRHRAVLNSAHALENLLQNQVAADPLRQVYHVMPAVNWMNDPCGMVYFRGEYHLFYQYDPYHITPRGMMFGHVKSRDLARWEQLPIALAPSEEFELYPCDIQGMNYGIFTGSAAVDGDRLVLLYCGSTYDGDGNIRQAICLATSEDGVHFQKHESNPVIACPPADGSRDFRDPKLWKRGNRWYALMGSSKDGHGEVLLYTSPNLTDWEYIGVTARGDGRFGTMWECPDFFELDGKHVLIFSPINMPDTDTCYMVGTMDYKTGKFTMESWDKLDKGYEYYAPQTLLDDRGRRIVIGWCAMWHHGERSHFTTYGPIVDRQWCGHMSIPRVLSLDSDNKLRMTPAPETALLRTGPSHCYRYCLKDAVQPLAYDFSRAAELQVMLDFGDAKAGTAGIRLRCSADGTHRTIIDYDIGTGTLRLDRRLSDGIYNDVQVWRAPAPDGRITFRVFTDSCSVELFADGDRLVLSNNHFPDPDHTGVELFAAGCRCTIYCEGWTLRA